MAVVEVVGVAVSVPVKVVEVSTLRMMEVSLPTKMRLAS